MLVPYPFALDDHQTYNAQQVVTCGGGVVASRKGSECKSLKELPAREAG